MKEEIIDLGWQGKCRICGKPIEGMRARMYCSSTCRSRARRAGLTRKRNSSNLKKEVAKVAEGLSHSIPDINEPIALRRFLEELTVTGLQFMSRKDFAWNPKKYQDWRDDPRHGYAKMTLPHLYNGKDPYTGKRLGPSWDIHHEVSPRQRPELCFHPLNMKPVNPDTHEAIHRTKRQRQLLLLEGKKKK